jgi:uncharacterized damage-inducible protein DinB
MNGKDYIRFALTVSNQAVLSAIDEMAHAPTASPTPNGGCHPLWVLGHLAVVEGMIPQVLFGEANAAEDWLKYFDKGTEPIDNVNSYPSFAEVRQRYVQLRERNLKLLDSLNEADLDKRTKVPPKGLEHEFSTYGRAFLTLALHQTMHRSHVTDARRALGSAALAKSA